MVSPHSDVNVQKHPMKTISLHPPINPDIQQVMSVKHTESRSSGNLTNFFLPGAVVRITIASSPICIPVEISTMIWWALRPL